MLEVTNTPIEDALVEIIQGGSTVKSGYTDADGKYQTTLGPGTYTIRISKTGYQTAEKTETLNYSTELMVNLEARVPSTGRSGIVTTVISGEAVNPILTTISKAFTTGVTTQTSSISTSYSTSIS